MSKKKISASGTTGEQVRRYAEGLQWGAEELIKLPKSGFPVILRRPTRIYFALRQSRWPVDFRARVDQIRDGVPGVELTAEDVEFFNRQQDRLADEAFVSPKLSLAPGPDQFDPRWLPDEDREFIASYLRGQVLADGTHLDTFRGGESRPIKDGGADREDLRTAAERSSGDATGRVAD